MCLYLSLANKTEEKKRFLSLRKRLILEDEDKRKSEGHVNAYEKKGSTASGIGKRAISLVVCQVSLLDASCIIRSDIYEL